MYARTVICRTLQNKSQPKFRNCNTAKTVDGTKISCKVISEKKANLFLAMTHADQNIFKLTAIILLVNLTPFLDLNVLCSCDRLTSDL